MESGGEQADEFELTNGQILDVQGRLKQHLSFWVDVLHAPALVIDWIVNVTCLLPLNTGLL